MDKFRRAILASCSSLVLAAQPAFAQTYNTPGQNQAAINNVPWSNGKKEVNGQTLSSILLGMNSTFYLYGPLGGSNTWTGANTFNGSLTFGNPSGVRSSLGAAASGANSDITSLNGLTTALSTGQGGTGSSSGFVTGNVAVGGVGGILQDGGNQLIKTGVAARDPGASDDSTQGYVQGSIWVNTASGALFVAGSVAPSAAVWTQATPTTYYAYESRGWSNGNISAGSTWYLVPGSAGVNQNTEAMQALSGSGYNLYVKLASAPGAGQSVTFTLYTGAPGAMSATAVTCAVSDANTACSDTNPAHAAALVIGNAWAVQVVSSAGAAGTGQFALGYAVKY